MKQIKTALIKGKERIECPYYQVEAHCQSIVEKYCLESEQKREEFNEFAAKYASYRPYFDFVICRLHYEILNPGLEEGKTLFGRGNNMYTKNTETGEEDKGFYCGLSDEYTLNKQQMINNPSNYRDCLVDGDGFGFFPKDMFGHVHLFQQLLNLLLICDKEACEDYLHYPYDIGSFVQKYIPLLRFQFDRNGSMLLAQSYYRERNITESQRQFHEFLLDNRYTYPSFLHKIETLDNCECKDCREELAYICDARSLHR